MTPRIFIRSTKLRYSLVALASFLLVLGILFYYSNFHKTVNTAIPKTKALQIVRSLPEVKKYISQLKNRNNLYIDASELKGKSGKKYWLVQIATINCIPSSSL